MRSVPLGHRTDGLSSRTSGAVACAHGRHASLRGAPDDRSCSWCSTPYAEGATSCSSCGANLVPDGDANLPGLTAVDAASIIRSKSAAQPRSRLMSWLSGEYASDAPSQAEAQAYAPPDQEVRREILRLEMEAEVAQPQGRGRCPAGRGREDGPWSPTARRRWADRPSDAATRRPTAPATAAAEPTTPPGERPTTIRSVGPRRPGKHGSHRRGAKPTGGRVAAESPTSAVGRGAWRLCCRPCPTAAAPRSVVPARADRPDRRSGVQGRDGPPDGRP